MLVILIKNGMIKATKMNWKGIKIMEQIIIKNKIAKLRKPLGLSQHSLAKSVGLKRHAIMSYENYQSYPTLDVAVKISKILNKNFTDVFDIN